MEHPIRQLIDNEKNEFKLRYWLNLTAQMISMTSGISVSMLNHLYYYPRRFRPSKYAEYYELLKKIDFSKFINKNILKSKRGQWEK